MLVAFLEFGNLVPSERGWRIVPIGVAHQFSIVCVAET